MSNQYCIVDAPIREIFFILFKIEFYLLNSTFRFHPSKELNQKMNSVQLKLSYGLKLIFYLITNQASSFYSFKVNQQASAPKTIKI
ncbi:hypothetical protein BpHYR1_002333 [Brachionus plicatilis]|uniref:Uncharacterized protein n=1 Tax=Brachionus plicatilis TaxID=10195 RepID=A0A3M7T6K0_BRAPC|nr:hypothetical protein BpHYR1_002333 [Brachionus plicatilis]